MDTNDRLRQRALRLMKEGVTQKTMAGRMGLSQATFSRWVRGDGPAVPVTALDGFQHYIERLLLAIQEDPRQGTQGDTPPQRDKPAAVGGRGAKTK